jgi:hypothetical protein
MCRSRSAQRGRATGSGRDYRDFEATELQNFKRRSCCEFCRERNMRRSLVVVLPQRARVTSLWTDTRTGCGAGHASPPPPWDGKGSHMGMGWGMWIFPLLMLLTFSSLPACSSLAAVGEAAGITVAAVAHDGRPGQSWEVRPIRPADPQRALRPGRDRKSEYEERKATILQAGHRKQRAQAKRISRQDRQRGCATPRTPGGRPSNE